MNETTPRIITVMATLLGILATGLLLLAIYQGIAGAAASHEVGVQRQLLADLRRGLRENVALAAEYETLAPKLGPRLRACTWNEQLPVMISQLTALADKQSISLTTMQPAPMTTTKGISRFPMRVSFHADLPRLTAFLQGVKEASPLLKVERLVIRHDPAGGNLLQLEITVASFVILDKAAPPAAERPKLVAATAAEAATPAAEKPAAGASASTSTATGTATPTAPVEQPTGWLRPPPVTTGSPASASDTSRTAATNASPDTTGDAPKTSTPPAEAGGGKGEGS